MAITAPRESVPGSLVPVPAPVVGYVGKLPASLLGLRVWRFGFGSLRSHPPRLEPGGAIVAGDGVGDAERAGLPAVLALPVLGEGQDCVQFLLTLVAGPGRAARVVMRRPASMPSGCSRVTV